MFDIYSTLFQYLCIAPFLLLKNLMYTLKPIEHSSVKQNKTKDWALVQNAVLAYVEAKYSLGNL